MTIAEIFKILKNPPNLQQHMLRVAKISSFILDNWKGKPVNRDLLVKAALLHDVGNIVKFNIQKYPQFLGEEQIRAEYWMKVQDEMIKKYGTDDHLATKQMLTELEIPQEVVNDIYAMSYWNAPVIKSGNNWILKILLYSDLRVSPSGIIPIKERLNDVHARLDKYKDRMDLYNAGLAIEKQIQENLTVNIEDITDDSMKLDEKILLEIQVKTK